MAEGETAQVLVDEALDFFQSKPVAVGVEGIKDLTLYPNPGYEAVKRWSFDFMQSSVSGSLAPRGGGDGEGRGGEGRGGVPQPQGRGGIPRDGGVVPQGRDGEGGEGRGGEGRGTPTPTPGTGRGGVPQGRGGEGRIGDPNPNRPPVIVGDVRGLAECLLRLQPFRGERGSEKTPGSRVSTPPPPPSGLQVEKVAETPWPPSRPSL